MILSITISMLVAVAVAAAVVYCCRGVARKARIGPVPTARSMHQQFTPLLGGVGIFGGLMAGVLVATLTGGMPRGVFSDHQFFWMGLAMIFLTGLLDDLRSLPFWVKFLLQLIAALALVVNGCIIEAFVAPPDEAFLLGPFSIPFTVLWIVFVINAINLLDGLDGLAGGVSVIAFAGFAVIAALQGSQFLILLAAIGAASVLGFLKFNRYPATIFMGDAGSLQLGYLLAFLSIEAFRVAGSHHVLFLSAIVLLGLPLSDTLMAFFRRLSQGHSPFHPDKQHVHHRLLHLGISHPSTVHLLYLIQSILTVLAILMVVYRDVTVYLLFGLFLLLAVYWMKRLGFLERYQQFSRWSLAGSGAERKAAAPPTNWPTGATVPLNLQRLWHQVLLFVGDALAIVGAIVVFFWIRQHLGLAETPLVHQWQDLFQYPVILYAVLIWTLLFWLNGLYDLGWDVSRYEHVTRLVRVTSFGILLLGFVTSDLQMPSSGSQWLALGGYWFIFNTLVAGVRLGIITVEKYFRVLEYAPKPTVVIGYSSRMAEFLQDVQENPHLLYQVKGVVLVEDEPPPKDLPVLGKLTDLPQIITRYRIREAIMDLPEQLSAQWLKAIAVCDRLHVSIRTFPGMADIFAGRSSAYANVALITLLPNPMVQWQWLLKRTLDVGLSIAVLGGLAPLLIGWSLWQRWQGRALFTRCTVLGKLGVPFRLFYLQLPAVADLCGNPRAKDTAPLQQWLYRHRIYKLVQVLNVLRGEMSWVGPRPEAAEWYQQLEEQVPFVYRRLFVRPGITGLGQMRYRYEQSQKALEARIRSDIFYVENMSLRMDVQILLRSAWILLFEGKFRGKR